MFADGVLPLVEKGVINGANKAIDKGKMVATFLMGSQTCYDFIDDNPMVLMKDVAYTNDPFIIAQNPKVTAINSALQVDITGQVCAIHSAQNFTRVWVVRWTSPMVLPDRRWQSHYCYAFNYKQGYQQNLCDPDSRSRCGHLPQSHSLVGNGVRCNQPLRKISPGACKAYHQHCTS